MTAKWWDGALLGFDLETTGVDPRVDQPVSYALALRREDGRVSADTRIVAPEVEVSEEAAKVHGYTTERARAEGMPVLDAALHVADKLLWAQESEIPLVGTNLAFDLTMVDSVLRDHGEPGLEAIGWHGPAIDVFVIDKHVDQYRRGSRKLTALCHHYGVTSLDDAHTAVFDAIACVHIVRAMALRHRGVEHRTPEELHKAQVGWRREQQESLSKHFVSKGQPALNPDDFGWPIYATPRPSEETVA